MQRSDWWTLSLWLAPTKMGLVLAWSGCCMCSLIHPWRWFQALHWVPNLSYVRAMINQYSHHHHHANEEGKWLLGVENTWGTRTWRGITVISCDTHLLGVTDMLFGLFRLQKLCWVILGPRGIFSILPKYGLYPLLHGVTAFAYDHGYGLNFF